MLTMLVVVLASVTSASAKSERELVRRCLKGDCAVLSVDGRTVKFQDSSNFIHRPVIGHYIAEDQRFVPATEAPIQHVRSHNGWLVIATATLDEYDPYGPYVRIRILDSSREVRETADGDYILDKLSVGRFLGTSDEILVMETSAFHSYAVTLKIWSLSADSKPKLLLDQNGTHAQFQPNGKDIPSGVWVERETYDGVNGNTKGRRREFWRWDPEHKTLNGPSGTGH